MIAGIGEHGLIGNLQTSALVSNRGTIDFMCIPDFDSPAVFGSLLEPAAGLFRVAPERSETLGTQLYLTDTAILLTRFYSAAGISELMDFMVIDPEPGGLQVIRRMRQVAGTGACFAEFRPKPDYGNDLCRLEFIDGRVSSQLPADRLWLYSTRPMQPAADGSAVLEHRLEEGEECWFVLSDREMGNLNEITIAGFCAAAYDNMYAWWTRWFSQCTYRGRWMEMVSRSAITLKLMCFEREGSMVAAPTFGLPENPGGERNWDYRYTWIRDSSLMVNALLKLGIHHEAGQFLNWVMKYCLPYPLRLLYTVRGEEVPAETNLSDWEGYAGSRPVRIGNNACWQIQLDTYGELLDTVALYLECRGALPAGFWDLLVPHVNEVCRRWREPDHGIWEVRGEKQEFLHSRLLCWVALDRAIIIADRLQLEHPREYWSRHLTEIRDSIETEFWDVGKSSFVQYRGTDELDAALLLMPLSGFIHVEDPRWISTMNALERELKLDVMIYRYRAGETKTDGLHGGEGTFTLCSFWYISCLARAGNHSKANGHFARLIRYANPLGLFAEQIGRDGLQLGNFPQGFTHLALIDTALELNEWFTPSR